MRTYQIPVNADLIDEIYPDINDWQAIVEVVHLILVAEHTMKISGAIGSAVRNRGCAAHVRDFV